MSDLAGVGILVFSCQGVMGGLRDRNQDSLEASVRVRIALSLK